MDSSPLEVRHAVPILSSYSISSCVVVSGPNFPPSLPQPPSLNRSMIVGLSQGH